MPTSISNSSNDRKPPVIVHFMRHAQTGAGGHDPSGDPDINQYGKKDCKALANKFSSHFPHITHIYSLSEKRCVSTAVSALKPLLERKSQPLKVHVLQGITRRYAQYDLKELYGDKLDLRLYGDSRPLRDVLRWGNFSEDDEPEIREIIFVCRFATCANFPETILNLDRYLTPGVCIMDNQGMIRKADQNDLKTAREEQNQWKEKVDENMAEAEILRKQEEWHNGICKIWAGGHFLLGCVVGLMFSKSGWSPTETMNEGLELADYTLDMALEKIGGAYEYSCVLAQLPGDLTSLDSDFQHGKAVGSQFSWTTWSTEDSLKCLLQFALSNKDECSLRDYWDQDLQQKDIATGSSLNLQSLSTLMSLWNYQEHPLWSSRRHPSTKGKGEYRWWGCCHARAWIALYGPDMLNAVIPKNNPISSSHLTFHLGKYMQLEESEKKRTEERTKIKLHELIYKKESERLSLDHIWASVIFTLGVCVGHNEHSEEQSKKTNSGNQRELDSAISSIGHTLKDSARFDAAFQAGVRYASKFCFSRSNIIELLYFAAKSVPQLLERSQSLDLERWNRRILKKHGHFARYILLQCESSVQATNFQPNSKDCGGRWSSCLGKVTKEPLSDDTEAGNLYQFQIDENGNFIAVIANFGAWCTHRIQSYEKIDEQLDRVPELLELEDVLQSVVSRVFEISNALYAKDEVLSEEIEMYTKKEEPQTNTAEYQEWEELNKRWDLKCEQMIARVYFYLGMCGGLLEVADLFCGYKGITTIAILDDRFWKMSYRKSVNNRQSFENGKIYGQNWLSISEIDWPIDGRPPHSSLDGFGKLKIHSALAQVKKNSTMMCVAEVNVRGSSTHDLEAFASIVDVVSRHLRTFEDRQGRQMCQQIYERAQMGILHFIRSDENKEDWQYSSWKETIEMLKSADTFPPNWYGVEENLRRYKLCTKEFDESGVPLLANQNELCFWQDWFQVEGREYGAINSCDELDDVLKAWKICLDLSARMSKLADMVKAKIDARYLEANKYGGIRIHTIPPDNVPRDTNILEVKGTVLNKSLETTDEKPEPEKHSNIVKTREAHTACNDQDKSEEQDTIRSKNTPNPKVPNIKNGKPKTGSNTRSEMVQEVSSDGRQTRKTAEASDNNDRRGSDHHINEQYVNDTASNLGRMDSKDKKTKSAKRKRSELEEEDEEEKDGFLDDSDYLPHHRLKRSRTSFLPSSCVVQ